MAAAAMALACGAAAAQLVADSNEPIDIAGDTLEIVDDVATWTGNVSAVQGEAVLTAEKLVAVLDGEGAFKTIEAIGAVRYSNGKEAITGETALYDAKARTIRMMRNVVVTQGETVMTGGDLLYWVDSGRLRFTAPEGRRIRGIFHSKSGGQRP
jgi:lipopolysaccharide export system protein LptA